MPLYFHKKLLPLPRQGSAPQNGTPRAPQHQPSQHWDEASFAAGRSFFPLLNHVPLWRLLSHAPPAPTVHHPSPPPSRAVHPQPSSCPLFPAPTAQVWPQAGHTWLGAVSPCTQQTSCTEGRAAQSPLPPCIPALLPAPSCSVPGQAVQSLSPRGGWFSSHPGLCWLQHSPEHPELLMATLTHPDLHCPGSSCCLGMFLCHYIFVPGSPTRVM